MREAVFGPGKHQDGELHNTFPLAVRVHFPFFCGGDGGRLKN